MKEKHILFPNIQTFTMEMSRIEINDMSILQQHGQARRFICGTNEMSLCPAPPPHRIYATAKRLKWTYHAQYYLFVKKLTDMQIIYFCGAQVKFNCPNCNQFLYNEVTSSTDWEEEENQNE